jgi:hypothetical protein
MPTTRSQAALKPNYHHAVSKENSQQDGRGRRRGTDRNDMENPRKKLRKNVPEKEKEPSGDR